MSYTPGKWEYTEPGNWYGIASLVRNEKAEPICQIPLSGWGKRKGRAIGHLIAAAPELLEALEDAMCLIPDRHKIKAKAEAAIKKARGEAMNEIKAAAERDFRGDKNKRMAENIQKLTDLGCTVYRDSRLIDGVLSRGYVVLDVDGIIIAAGENLDCAMHYAIYKIETGEDVPDMENAKIDTKGGA